jgi:hypothetical protein
MATQLTGLATTGSRVFQSRVYPLQDANLPCLLIYSKTESSTPLTIGASDLDRRLTVEVAAVTKASSDLDDTLDEICRQVEVALAGGIGTAAKSVILTGTEIELEGTAERPVGRATMSFECEYMTKQSAPDVAL